MADSLTLIVRARQLAQLDPGTPTPSAATLGLDTEEMMSLFRTAFIAMDDRLLFIAHMSITACQSAVPHEARIQMLHEIGAACRGEFPEWWTAFKKEHDLGGYRG